MRCKWASDPIPQRRPIGPGPKLFLGVEVLVGVTLDELGSLEPHRAHADGLDLDQAVERVEHDVAVGLSVEEIFTALDRHLFVDDVILIIL
jgi:hypothetical protein